LATSPASLDLLPQAREASELAEVRIMLAFDESPDRTEGNDLDGVGFGLGRAKPCSPFALRASCLHARRSIDGGSVRRSRSDHDLGRRLT
jgi:hypothetical protein